MSRVIRIKAEIGAQFSFFATTDGEGYSGGGSYMIEDFAKESGELLEQTLIRVLKDNPNQIISLVITTEGIEYDETIVPGL